MSRVWIICKKIFSLTLLFNALLTIACSVSILSSVYWIYPGWKPFSPYLVDGNVFWVVIVAAALNVFPSALLGRKLHTGRFLFHHYMYGFLVLAVATIYVTFFTPVSVATIFLVNNTAASVNVGRFLLLGGLTLLLDDLPDVAKPVETALNLIKAWVFRIRKLVTVVQIGAGVISVYLFVAVCVAMIQVSEWVTLANFILIITTLITAVTSVIFVKRKVWDSIMSKQESKH